MRLKKLFIFLFSLLLLVPSTNLFAQISNTGFVSGNIWYSQNTFDEGDKVNIYTFLFNPDDRELSGTVIFFDKATLLGKKDFVIPGKTADEVYISWTATVGEHTIFAKIENAKYKLANGDYEEVYIAENETQKSERKVKKKILENLLNTEGDNEILSKVSDLTETVADKTPDFIKEPISSTTNTIESWRVDTSVKTANKKEEIKKEIEQSKSVKPEEKRSPLLTPLKYIQLFFFTLVNFIFDHRILFYGLIILSVFYIFKYIWNKFH